MAKNAGNFLVVGDVYRKDEINRSHYPVFHQMEGVGMVPDGKDPSKELIRVLNGLVEYLFPGCEYRVNSDYFPFTDPSFEYEVKFNGEWLEILGCGEIHSKILENNKLNKKGWAFGLGLERLAMILFGIQDIRLFWSTDNKFLDQFSEGKMTTFVPFSNVDPMILDVSFWISNCEIVERLRDEDKAMSYIKNKNKESTDLTFDWIHEMITWK